MISSGSKDQYDNLKSHLVMIKSLKTEQAQQEFYELLTKAKQALGQLSPQIALFHFQYGSFLLGKIQKNMDFLNAGVVPEGQQNQDYDDIPEVYDEDSEEQKNGANEQKVEKKESNPQKVVYEDQNMQIIEDSKQKMQQKIEQGPGLTQGTGKKQDSEQDLDDIEIAYENLEVALNIYEKERKKLESGQQSVLPKQQIYLNIVRIHSRLGDLFMVDQKFSEAIDEYNTVIKLLSYDEDRQYNRRISQTHFMIGNCILHDNKQNCQKLAIREFIQAVAILIKCMQVEHHYNVQRIQIPTEYSFKVDRFAYLSYPSDSDKVKQIKQVASLLLDKIEDTYEQIGQRQSYEVQKAKLNKAKEQNTFKQVSKDVKVISLGTFGNRKKTPNPNDQTSDQILSQKKQIKSQIQSQCPSESEKVITKSSESADNINYKTPQ